MKQLLFILICSISSLFAFEEVTGSNFEEKIKDKDVIVEFYNNS